MTCYLVICLVITASSGDKDGPPPTTTKNLSDKVDRLAKEIDNLKKQLKEQADLIKQLSDGDNPKTSKVGDKVGDKVAELGAPNTALIKIKTSSDTIILVDGSPIKLTGILRVCITPSLEPGRNYYYTIVAQKGNKSTTKRVYVKANDTTEVEIYP